MASDGILDNIEDCKDIDLVEAVRKKLLHNKYVGVKLDQDDSGLPKVKLLDGSKDVTEELARHLCKVFQHPDVSSSQKANSAKILARWSYSDVSVSA